MLAQVVLVVARRAEILRRPVVVRRHQIEADTALGEMVEGRPEARRR